MYPLTAEETLKAFANAKALSDDYHVNLIGSIDPYALGKLEKFLKEHQQDLETFLEQERL